MSSSDGPLFSRNTKKTHTDQSILQTFLLCLKKKSHKPLKVAAAKKSLPSVYITDTTCLGECFLFRDNWKTLFFM